MPNVNTWSACEEEIGTSYQPPASARAPWYACVTSTLSSPFSDMVQGQPESDALGCRLSKPCVSAAKKSRQVVMLKAPGARRSGLVGVMQSGIRGGRVSEAEAEAHGAAGHWGCCAGRRGKWTLQELCRAMRLAVSSKRASWRKGSEDERGAETQGAPWPESTRHFISASRSTRLLTDIDSPDCTTAALHVCPFALCFCERREVVYAIAYNAVSTWYPSIISDTRTHDSPGAHEDPHQRRYSRQS